MGQGGTSSAAEGTLLSAIRSLDVRELKAHQSSPEGLMLDVQRPRARNEIPFICCTILGCLPERRIIPLHQCPQLLGPLPQAGVHTQLLFDTTRSKPRMGHRCISLTIRCEMHPIGLGCLAVSLSMYWISGTVSFLLSTSSAPA